MQEVDYDDYIVDLVAQTQQESTELSREFSSPTTTTTSL
jgi:hypothetical protein